MSKDQAPDSSGGEEAQELCAIPLLTRDGRVVHPQPTRDAHDPLNWSPMRRRMILGIVMWMYFLFAYLNTSPIPLYSQTEQRFGVGYQETSWSVALPSVGFALGPLLLCPIADIYGRRIVFIGGSLVALVATIGLATTTSFEGYLVARVFQGIGVSPSSATGLAIIGDLFFDYERGQKMGLWVLAIDTGFLMGAMFRGIIDLAGEKWVYWLNAILLGILFLLVLLCLPETLYPRHLMLHQLPMICEGTGQSGARSQKNEPGPSPPVLPVELRRTRDLPFFNLTPVPGIRHLRPWETLVRFAIIFRVAAFTIPLFSFCLLVYWWNPAALTMIPAAYPEYPPVIQGLFFTGFLVGMIFAETFCSGRLSDHICAKLMAKNDNVHVAKNDNVHVAEMRLWLVYPSCLLASGGLCLWGISVDRGYHWMVGQVAFFLFAVGFQTSSTVLVAYLVDSYPLQSTAVIISYSVVLNISEFASPFFLPTWEAAQGWTWTYATQALIVSVAALPVFCLTHIYGPWLRSKSYQPYWVNVELDTTGVPT
ncbi:MFS transporter [Aspergillus aculeatinus CBS 121060]|uniref:MFS transporter n=1 Tax=Aspergillus aculeatinus CBS 121060 TaxID=1448322 RepID=A0ACD1GTF2_9EURO|nr:MFS transporter [Aspergillus aculeatinus CBS 121060]RAH64598.1 MFS transporter [Aspergillus aculeatinus CBS 121060]